MSEYFPAFGKIPRFNREVVVTEKIDGTNGVIEVGEGDLQDSDGVSIRAGSRNRWLTPEEDNHGFARWVSENAASLVRDLGPGLHYGEWYGQGVQRGYGLTEKRFMLFNTARWGEASARFRTPNLEVSTVLWEGGMKGLMSPLEGPEGFEGENHLTFLLSNLKVWGSQHVRGFDRPEGIVLYHTAANSLFKILLENDDVLKGN